ncbi:MAG TPA: amino acid ABC transporter substrate-binding protein [Usitatibacter sp.]|nr:amino acid ABC transporter substrate-binding protein [Usitatibacter sp.]
MHRTLKAAAAAVACALLAAPVAAQTLDKIKQSGFITVGHRDASIPFSYYDDNQKPIGYAMELCGHIVNAVKKELKMPNLEVKYQLVTSANRWVAKKSSNIKSLNDLKGKTVVSTAGTTNIKQITKLNADENLGMNIISANGHPEAFQMVETGRAVAFIMDDILEYSLAANSRNPSEWEIGSVALSVEPYGIMLRKDDPAFKKVVNDEMTRVYKSGEINQIYDKWFLKPIPPKGLNLNVPMSDQFKKVVANPTDSGDPAAYK